MRKQDGRPAEGRAEEATVLPEGSAPYIAALSTVSPFAFPRVVLLAAF